MNKNGISALLILCLGLTGCVTVGKPVATDRLAEIKAGQTTRQEIETKFGQPFRTGLDSGDQTATYLYYRFGLFSKPITTDLKVVYSKDGKVKSYIFDSNQTESSQDINGEEQAVENKN